MCCCRCHLHCAIACYWNTYCTSDILVQKIKLVTTLWYTLRLVYKNDSDRRWLAYRLSFTIESIPTHPSISIFNSFVYQTLSQAAVRSNIFHARLKHGVPSGRQTELNKVLLCRSIPSFLYLIGFVFWDTLHARVKLL